MCSRADFEEKLGPMSELKAQAYLADPRKLVADFYKPGDNRGPPGFLGLKSALFYGPNLSKFMSSIELMILDRTSSILLYTYYSLPGR